MAYVEGCREGGETRLLFERPRRRKFMFEITSSGVMLLPLIVSKGVRGLPSILQVRV